MNNWFTYVFLIIYTLAPLCTIWLLHSKFSHLEDRSFNNRFNTLYEELDTKKKWPIIIFKASFYMRRILLVVAILLAKHLCFQIVLLLVQVFLHIVVIGILEPYKAPSKKNRELVNEFVIVLAVYHVMCFSPVVADIDTRIYIGYSFITLIVTHTVVSLGLIARQILKESLWQYKRNRVIKNHLSSERILN